MNINLNVKFMIDNNIQIYEAIVLYEKGWISEQHFQDYISVLIERNSYLSLEPKLIEILLIPHSEKYQLDKKISDLKNELKGSVPESINDRILFIIFKWIQINKFYFEDPIEFREFIFEVLRSVDFPPVEVEYFLSDFILDSIPSKIDTYLKNKENLIKISSL